ncbi:DUF3500 domain-containing protein [Pedobacter sp. PWIIR3]
MFKTLVKLSVIILLYTSTAAAQNKSKSNIEEILKATNAFINALSKEQQAAVIVEYTQANAVKWTNLPCGLSCRVGVLFGSLNQAQLSLAKAVAKAALGTMPTTGYTQYEGIMQADAALGKSKDGYSSGNYIIAFLGKPSATGKWQLQFGGHHLAINLTFEAGKVIGASPNFMGLEPPENTTLKNNHDAMVDMLTSLTSDQQMQAKLAEGFDDVFLGPGKDGQFPAKKYGVKASTLNKKQKALIIAALENWVHIADNETAKSILSGYAKQLDDTYIAYFGSPTLKNKGDYVRIDGPQVWIEFICQQGAVYPQGIHYHTVYRDHLKDYGGSFRF